MFKRSLIASLSCLALNTAVAQALPGKPAPAFSGQDLNGKTISLADLKGRYVVLEWTNPDCPFVRKHYDSSNMPSLQKQVTGKGVTWVTLQTVAAGDASRMRSELSSWQKTKGANATVTLIDSDGKIASTYRAMTTPHMYVIDPKGDVIYAGAIDSKASTNAADIKTSTNYVAQAVDEALAGKPISQPSTQAYGCAIKYPKDA